MKKFAPVALVGMVLLAGCTGFGGVPATEPTETASPSTAEPTGQPSTTTSESDSVNVSNASARERAIRAETERVGNVLNATSNYSDRAIFRGKEAQVLDRNGTGVVVRARVPYGYGYNCSGNAGFVDSQTDVVYLVTENETRLLYETKDVLDACG